MHASQTTSAVFVFLFMVLSPGKALAVDNDQELQISGGFFLAEGDASTGTAQGEVSYGYHLNSKWQTGVRWLFSYSLNDPAEDVWTGSTTGFLNYYLRDDRTAGSLQPFIGTFIGLGYSDVDITGTAGPTLGVKYFINDTTSLVAQYRFEVYFDDLDAGDETDDFTDSNHVFTIGVGFHW